VNPLPLPRRPAFPRLLRNALFGVSAWLVPAAAAEYFVAPDGRDDAPGTSLAQPFRTWRRAAEVLQPGDTCWIRGGTYRETLTLTRGGRPGAPITFAGWRGERVILDGADPVMGPWARGADGVWSTPWPATQPVEAVFGGERMMSEARWPDCTWEENWQPERKWAATGAGSELGQIRSAALARAGVDLTGGLLYLKLGKGNSCHTRPILQHRAGDDTLRYDATGIEGRAWREDSMPERLAKHGFADNRFFVLARGALDAPGEWWHDTEAERLLFLPPPGIHPAAGGVRVKSRPAAILGSGVSDLVFEGLEFQASQVRLEDARRVTLRRCRFLFPATPRLFPDAETERRTARNLRLAGEDNVVERCEIAWAVDGALEIEGAGNRVEDCVVRDSNLHGRHPGPAIRVHSTGRGGNLIRGNTVYNLGSVGLYLSGEGANETGYNHVFNAGLYCVDVAAIYLPLGGALQGTRVHHNWLHDLNGLGFRVDLQGRDLTFDHNLVWHATAGCKLQGFRLSAHHNTVLVHEPRSGFLVVFEPAATPAERAGWRVRNNVAYAYLDRLSLRADPRRGQRRNLLPLASEPGAIEGNHLIVAGEEDRLFADFLRNDFRPRPAGPLDGTALPLVAGDANHAGQSASRGALEPWLPPWRPGAGWRPDTHEVPATPAAASLLARAVRPERVEVGQPNPGFDQP
jgi:hypothetical protein